MNLKELVLEALFPSRCLPCGTLLARDKRNYGACDTCIGLVETNNTLFCIVCRARLAGGKRICHADSPLRLAAAGRYSDPRLKALITRLKYRRNTGALATLSLLMERYLRDLSHPFTDYHIVAIPLHRTRERQRGFNQSLLLAKRAAQLLGLPIIENGLIKIRATLAQAGTRGRAERIENLKNCFEVTDPSAIAGKSILLIDDVCTSGTTLIEAANTLKKSGGKNIIGLVMAKTD